MRAIIYIPFANGDCINGFEYEHEITPIEYSKMQIEEYNTHKNGINTMMVSRFGDNMSINNYQKQKYDYKHQQFDYHKCECNILNIDGNEQTLADLDEKFRNREQFVLIINLKRDEVSKNPDLEIDVNMWIKDSLKINNCRKISDSEKLIHLPKKDFKLKILEDKSNAILKDCKFLDTMGSNTSFAILVTRLIFTKD